MVGREFEAAAEDFRQAVDDNDREKLRDTREVLTAISQRADDEAAELAAAAKRLLESDAASMGAGECQEADPFAPAYIVIVEGKAVWRCQHNPPHNVPA
jgi:hypothetical protein